MGLWILTQWISNFFFSPTENHFIQTQSSMAQCRDAWIFTGAVALPTLPSFANLLRRLTGYAMLGPNEQKTMGLLLPLISHLRALLREVG